MRPQNQAAKKGEKILKEKELNGETKNEWRKVISWRVDKVAAGDSDARVFGLQ